MKQLLTTQVRRPMSQYLTLSQCLKLAKINPFRNNVMNGYYVPSIASDYKKSI